MKVKFPFKYVENILEKVYEKQFDESDLQGISNHCSFIKKFLDSYGWSEDDYVKALTGDNSNNYELIFEK